MPSGGDGVAGLLDGALQVVVRHLRGVVAHLDGATLEVRVRVLDAGEIVQFLLDGGLAVAAAQPSTFSVFSVIVLLLSL